MCAAISAARLGCRTVLVQDRPVLGGNASSEIRVPIGGAASGRNRNARETGIIEELLIENAERNPERSFPIQDSIYWEWVTREPNVTLYLNTRAKRVRMNEGEDQIVAVEADQDSTECQFRFNRGGSGFYRASVPIQWHDLYRRQWRWADCIRDGCHVPHGPGGSGRIRRIPSSRHPGR
jgi:hypothetical protein